MLRALFTDHPASVGETYGEHLRMASGFAGRMLFASLACFLHGLLPFLFVSTGSRTIVELHARMATRRRRRAPAQPSAHRPLGADALPDFSI